MPAKKKKGKGSKLARMSEEEKIRYLQHRAEIELEAKRRKQQLIAVFTKNKLKREEAFARLNTAKINEQWRFILRQVKCKELYDDLEYLWRNFDSTLKAKDALIHKLYDELENADKDHKRLQEAHMETVDEFIERHRKQLEDIHQRHLKSVMEIEIGGLNEMNLNEQELEKDCKDLESVIYAQTDFIETKLMETRTRNAINTYFIEHSKEEAIARIKHSLGGKIHQHWSMLIKIISEYQSVTHVKRKQYEGLKELDDVHRHEAAQFPKLQAHLQNAIETLKDLEGKLHEESKSAIADLHNQSCTFNDRIWNLRQEIRMNQTMDQIHLKKLSVMSGSVIRELKKIEGKSSTLITLFKICACLIPNSLSVKKYSLECLEGLVEIEGSQLPVRNCMMRPYDKLENFWEQFNYIKVDNIFNQKERNELLIENKKLRTSLRTYLVTVARMPISRPQTSI